MIIITLIISFAVFLINLFSIIFRLLDEVFFYGYRKTKIEKPVFIISNPRSGTTYLHRLMTLDKNRFAYFRLYHTLGNAILFNKMVGWAGKIDRRIGRPARRFFDWTDKVMFGKWKDIHPMGWNKSEEDEALFFFSFSTPSAGLFYPYIKSYDWITFPDYYPEKKAKKLMKFYRNSLKRFMYSEGKDKILLTKNVFSTGRIQLILAAFPDAKIIYPVRNPRQAVPSFVSMFATPWKTLYPFIPENSATYRYWGYIAIRFYQHIYKISSELPAQKMFILQYKTLISEPYETVRKIYRSFLDFEVGKEFDEALISVTGARRKYKSKHTYSMEQYGFEKDIIGKKLGNVLEKFFPEDRQS